VGEAAGVAGNADGSYLAGMGIACGDPEGDGLPELVVTNFYGEGATLYRNHGRALFSDQSAGAGLLQSTKYVLGFGVAFLDANNDGRLDLAMANGHVNDLRPFFPYAMAPQLMLGTAGGRLVDISSQAGEAWAIPHVARGLALGDMDNDGRMDLLMLTINEPLVYLHNKTSGGGHFVTFQLEGKSSNRDGVAARVTLEAGGRRQVAQRFGGGSYLSAGDPRLHFGLGTADRVDSVEVRWPSGCIDAYRGLSVDRGYLLVESVPEPRPLAGFRGGNVHASEN
jgi:hypothetical protein